MGIVLVLGLAVLVVVVLLVIIGHRNASVFDASVELISDEPEEQLFWEDKVALEFFSASYKVVKFEEVDGTSGIYIMDRKTHAVCAYALHSDGLLKLVKQQQVQEKK